MSAAVTAVVSSSWGSFRDDLAMVLEGDPTPGGGRINLRTGAVLPDFTFEYLVEVGEEPDDEDEDHDQDRWLQVWGEGSRGGYGDMEDFIDARTDPDWADRLRIAIQGRGTFRRFRDVLARSSDEFAEFHAFSDDRQRGRARAWLADQGYCVAARRPAG